MNLMSNSRISSSNDQRSVNRRIGLPLCVFCASILVGCATSGEGAASSGSAADISPAAPTMNAKFEARNPRVCTKVTHVPNSAEAAVMAQCDYESASGTSGSTPSLFLATNVELELGSAKAYNPGVDNFWDNIDPSAKVYPVRGSSVGYVCLEVNPYNKGKNCQKSYGGQAGQGACWHTQFNEWHCRMTMGGPEQAPQVPGPTTF